MPTRMLVAFTAGAVLVTGPWGSATVAASESQAFPPVVTAPPTDPMASAPAQALVELDGKALGPHLESLTSAIKTFALSPLLMTVGQVGTIQVRDHAMDGSDTARASGLANGVRIDLRLPTFPVAGSATLAADTWYRRSLTSAEVIGHAEVPLALQAGSKVIWAGTIPVDIGLPQPIQVPVLVRGVKPMPPSTPDVPDPAVDQLRLTIRGLDTEDGTPVIAVIENGKDFQTQAPWQGKRTATITGRITALTRGDAELHIKITIPTEGPAGSQDQQEIRTRIRPEEPRTNPLRWVQSPGGFVRGEQLPVEFPTFEIDALAPEPSAGSSAAP